MGLINPLIPELFAHLIDPIVASDNELFQEQFRRDAHNHILIKIVMMRLKRLGRRSSGDQIHHRSFHLQESQLVQKVFNVFDNLRSLHENVPCSVVHDQI